MAVELQGLDIGILVAGADLTTYQFKGVKISDDFTVVAATAGACDGILQNKPDTGEAAQMRISGLSKIVLGGTVAARGFIKTDSSAEGVAADTDKDQYIAQCIEGGDDGDTVTGIVGSGFLAV